VARGEIPGRSGDLALQGEEFLASVRSGTPASATAR